MNRDEDIILMRQIRNKRNPNIKGFLSGLIMISGIGIIYGLYYAVEYYCGLL